MDINRAIISGRVGHDIETRNSTTGDECANFSVASGKKWKDKMSGEMKESTQWHRVVCWGFHATLAKKYIQKGTEVFVEGEIKYSKFTGKDGIERNKTEIVCSFLKILSNGKKINEEEQFAPVPTANNRKQPEMNFAADDFPF